ncbi:MAG: hypothetical protein D6753_12685 [Planctomycetota bacterium]|nr:MAG: hypothetical protein D6753_12685 [Planctomycetota bacterium]
MPRFRPSARRRASRAGFTLVEVLVATAATLLMMIALAQMFKVIGDSMKQGRAALQLNNKLRTVAMRLQHDLSNLTVIPDPPINEGQGYFKYFDGSTTDYTAATIDVTLNRFGDVDDILMGTVRAGDVWFTGKVPRYFITRTEPTSAADFSFVTIAAQHAEVIAFLQPIVTNVGNPTQDPAYYLTASRNGAVAFQDVDGPLGAGNGFPDGFRLHYRRLLIRPDLNLPSPLAISALGATAPAGALPAGRGSNAGGPVNWTIAQPQPGLPSPLCDMTAAHQQCDLSIRRVFGSGPAAFDFVAANSLEDLANPANRFAHVQVPLPGTSSTTMPVLALGPALPVHGTDPSGTLTNAALSPPATDPAFRVGSGFLHPAFALYGTRIGEDLLASNILAFDVKAYDPGVPLLASTGPDGAPGAINVDDDNDGTTDNASEFGADGSDDLVLSPNDPGYATLLGGTAAGFGEYVDLCWGRKTVLPLLAAGGSIPSGANLFSPFSGLSATNFASNGLFRGFTDPLYKSGLVLTTTTPSIHLLQPSFDTWTTEYERDGILQAQRSGREGVCRISGANALYGIGGPDLANALPAWRQTAWDAGTDGVDNNQNGSTDEMLEQETSPPFPFPLQGIKIVIRMEDVGTGQIKQMSVAKEFVSQ